LISNLEEENGKEQPDRFSPPLRKQFQVTADNAWRVQAMSSGIEPLVRFAEGLQDDLAAIQAGLTLPWSNGVTEGQINRLKLLKRQGYGRAGVALLRQRLVQES